MLPQCFCYFFFFNLKRPGKREGVFTPLRWHGFLDSIFFVKHKGGLKVISLRLVFYEEMTYCP